MTAFASSPPGLRTTEAAVVSGVRVRDVDRVIDEKLLPADFLRNAGRGLPRSLSPISCLFITFYYGTEERLTATLRRSLMGRIRGLLIAGSVFDITTDLLNRSWIIEQDELTLDLRRHVETAVRGMELLREARNRVESSAALLGGADVIKGTRIMVRDLAAALEAGRDAEDILADYEHPRLTARDVELAGVHARAYPPRGRPPLKKALADRGYRSVSSSG